MRPVFAEYELLERPPGVAIDWPWRHLRLPLHPALTLTMGRDTACTIITSGADRMGGRRNHTITFTDPEGWRTEHLGHSLPIGLVRAEGRSTLTGRPSEGHAALSPGDVLIPAPGISLRLQTPEHTGELWSALGSSELGLLERLDRAHPAPPDTWFADSYRPWLAFPQADPSRLVLLDWIIGHGVEPDGAEVELAHLLAWRSFLATRTA